MLKLLGFLLIVILVGCAGVTLADRISLGIVEYKAKVKGEYCYIKNTGDKFCMNYKGMR